MIDAPRDTKTNTWKQLRRHLPRPVTFLLLTMLVGLLTVTFAPRKYESNAKLFVRLGRESVGVDPTANAIEQKQPISFSGRDHEINSIVEMLQNRDIYAQVVQRLTPEVVLEHEDLPLPEDGAKQARSSWTQVPARWISATVSGTVRAVGNAFNFREGDIFDEAVEQLAEKVHIDAPRKSTVIEIRYRSPSPQLSQRIVSEIVQQILQMHPKWNRAENSTDFFADQVRQADEKLNEAHARFADKKSAMNVAALETHRQELARQLSELETTLRADRRDLQAARSRMEALEQTLRTVDQRVVTQVQSGIADAGRDTMRGRLYDLELQERDLAARYHDDYPPLAAVRQQLSAAKAVLSDTRDERSNTTQGLNPIRTEAEKTLALQIPEVAARQSRVTASEQQHAEICQRIADFNQDEIQLAAMNRQVELAENTFRAYAKSWEESRIDRDLQTELISNLNVVQSASYQPEAIFPKELISLLAFALIGLTGAGWILWNDLGKKKALRSPAEISSALRSPVVASFPYGRERAAYELDAEK